MEAPMFSEVRVKRAECDPTPASYHDIPNPRIILDLKRKNYSYDIIHIFEHNLIVWHMNQMSYGVFDAKLQSNIYIIIMCKPPRAVFMKTRGNKWNDTAAAKERSLIIIVLVVGTFFLMTDAAWNFNDSNVE